MVQNGKDVPNPKMGRFRTEPACTLANQALVRIIAANFLLDSLGESALTFLIILGGQVTDQAQLLPGTLDLLILRAVSLGPLHGYGVLLRIGQISGNALLIEQGALYPGLFRLVRQGLLKASWGTSDNNRRAKFYELTASGQQRLREETANWNRLVDAIGCALSAQPEEV
jgi:PadR family transcriptional regulator PadR